MDLRIFTEPQQGATYDTLVRVGETAEDLGFDAYFRSDHYIHFDGDGLPGPSDAWLTLGALARDVAHPSRHPRNTRDLPVAGSARHRGRAGGLDVEWPRRTRPRCGLE